jgi:hypothetical protein
MMKITQIMFSKSLFFCCFAVFLCFKKNLFFFFFFVNISCSMSLFFSFFLLLNKSRDQTFYFFTFCLVVKLLIAANRSIKCRVQKIKAQTNMASPLLSVAASLSSISEVSAFLLRVVDFVTSFLPNIPDVKIRENVSAILEQLKDQFAGKTITLDNIDLIAQLLQDMIDLIAPLMFVAPIAIPFVASLAAARAALLLIKKSGNVVQKYRSKL